MMKILISFIFGILMASIQAHEVKHGVVNESSVEYCQL
jgi:hypothetical protein